jgi:hypothetical protein
MGWRCINIKKLRFSRRAISDWSETIIRANKIQNQAVALVAQKLNQVACSHVTYNEFGAFSSYGKLLLVSLFQPKISRTLQLKAKN